MRCDLCPLCPPHGEYGDDVCPEMDGPLGIVHRDGMGGCKHPYNWVKKRDDEYSDYLGKMGEEMGREMMQEGYKNENQSNHI